MIRLIVEANKWFDNLSSLKRTIFFFVVIVPFILMPYIIGLILPNLFSDNQIQMIWLFIIGLLTSLRMIAMFKIHKENNNTMNKKPLFFIVKYEKSCTVTTGQITAIGEPIMGAENGDVFYNVESINYTTIVNQNQLYYDKDEYLKALADILVLND